MKIEKEIEQQQFDLPQQQSGKINEFVDRLFGK
jgi:hypothetical protein